MHTAVTENWGLFKVVTAKSIYILAKIKSAILIVAFHIIKAETIQYKDKTI